jgi:hypothetical protein
MASMPPKRAQQRRVFAVDIFNVQHAPHGSFVSRGVFYSSVKSLLVAIKTYAPDALEHLWILAQKAPKRSSAHRRFIANDRRLIAYEWMQAHHLNVTSFSDEHIDDPEDAAQTVADLDELDECFLRPVELTLEDWTESAANAQAVSPNLDWSPEAFKWLDSHGLFELTVDPKLTYKPDLLLTDYSDGYANLSRTEPPTVTFTVPAWIGSCETDEEVVARMDAELRRQVRQYIASTRKRYQDHPRLVRRKKQCDLVDLRYLVHYQVQGWSLDRIAKHYGELKPTIQSAVNAAGKWVAGKAWRYWKRPPGSPGRKRTRALRR